MFSRQKNTHHNKIAGFYANCEYDKNQIATSRYYTMLVDTMSNSEMNNSRVIPSHQQFGTGYKSFWNGDNINLRPGNAAPYIKSGDGASTFGWVYGYGGGHWESFRTDQILNSSYETWAPMIDSVDAAKSKHKRYASIPITNFKYYETPHINVPDSLDFITNPDYLIEAGNLIAIEKNVYRSYFKRKSSLFNNKPWVAWMWIDQPWIYDSTQQCIYNKDFRPLTGEELNLEYYYPIALGAKGLVSWFKAAYMGSDFQFSLDSNSKDKDNTIDVSLQPSNSRGFQTILSNYLLDTNHKIESILTHPAM